MSLERKEIFEFGEFRLDAEEHTIERIDGTPNGTLTEKAFCALVLLIRRRGHLVPKDELIKHVWPDTIVEDNNLEKCVHHIRHFLGETSEGKPYIQTVRKHGYRFVGRVDVVEVSGTWLPETFRLPDEDKNAHATNEDATAAGLGLSPESTNGSGMSPRLLGLSKKTKLRQSVTYVVSGIVLLLMGLSIYAYLNGGHILRVNPSTQLGTTNEEAASLYHQAQNLSVRRNSENMPTAMEYLNRAVTLDPDFARAWAAKAHLHRYLAEYPGGDQAEQYNGSMRALRKALDIDPNLSEAHSALCLNKLRYEYDYVGAERECILARELDPGSAVGHKAYGTFLFSRGRFDEAIAESKLAVDLQPLAPENLQTYALALYYAGRYEEEETTWKRLIELNPTHRYIYTRLFTNLKQQGKDDQAYDYLIKHLKVAQVDKEIIERFRAAYTASGWKGVTIERIKHPELEPFTGPFDVACLYATIGDRDKAFEYLEKAYLERSYRIAVLQVEPQLNPLRDDPRYADLVRRVEAQN